MRNSEMLSYSPGTSLDLNATTTTVFNSCTLLFFHNDSMVKPESSTKYGLGFISAAVAIICFGCNLVPVRKQDIGDGLFYQWIMVTAVLLVGVVVNLIRGSPKFYPIAMLGGFLWATGNITCLLVVKTIGLGLGMMIWSALNLLCGWASGRFGWFGLNPQIPESNLLNYLGVSLAILRAFIFIFVKRDVNEQKPILGNEDMLFETDPLIESAQNYESIHTIISSEDVVKANNNSVAVETPMWGNIPLSELQQRTIGVVAAFICGICFGFNFVPVTYIQQNKHNNGLGLDLVFAHFCGVFLTGTVYFLIYCIVKLNKPVLNSSLVLPATFSGALWGIGQSAWFIANASLKEAISFPIITTGPSLIAALWSVFYFKEIRGLKNYLALTIAFVLAIAGSILTGLSRVLSV